MKPRVTLEAATQQAAFVERTGRFSALVEWEEGRERVFLPNSGRLRELLLPDRRVLLAYRPGIARQTRFDLVIVCLEHVLVWVDARTPPHLVSAAILQGALPSFEGYSLTRAEHTYGDSRLDLLLAYRERACLVEVKSVTLVQEGLALFPDAPTKRGTRHLGALARAVGEGHEAAVIFVAQRADAHGFAPNDGTDADFGRALRAAAAAGVRVHAYRCAVTPAATTLEEEIPVHL